ncbi:MAG TPA: DUF3108 domain-containing protein [bacterium]|uniref:DUF3108 domain-containing protein n=1 Tax=candidate division TA06 bacterium ADurb.Bin417 TaxID=1852828 RepID=A0A1V5MLC2_UNCT6|nr:MAG: hypothetical protein BWY73_00071 [candidate division TA06 bacterium ADurb.Bin417]HNS48242.1 DUF3108 domain-containing protein [bacterium]
MRAESILIPLTAALLLAGTAGLEAAPRAGETLRYQLKWNVVSGGFMNVSVEEAASVDSESTYHLKAYMETGGLFKKLYPFTANIDSYPAVSDFLPRRYLYRSNSKEERIAETVDFSRTPPEGTWKLDKFEYDRNRSQKKSDRIKTSGFFQDPLSIIYYLRGQKLQVGSTLTVPLYMDRREYRIAVKVTRRSYLRVMGRVWDTLVVEPDTSYKTLPFQRGTLWIFFSNDAERLPLYFTAKAPLGLVSATLVEITR